MFTLLYKRIDANPSAHSTGSGQAGSGQGGRMNGSGYLALATANNTFDDFQIMPRRKHRLRFLPKSIIAILLLIVMGLGYLSNIVQPGLNEVQGASFPIETGNFPMLNIDPELMDVPKDYVQINNIDLDSLLGGDLSKTQIASQNTKTSFQVKDQSGNETGVSFELSNAGAGEISRSGNKITRRNIFSGIDLEQEVYDGYLNQIMTITNDRTNKEFTLPMIKNDNLILEDYFGHVLIKDKNTNEELILLRFPQGIDNKNKRIDYKYEINGDRLRLYPNRSWQYDKASYPIKIYLPINVIAWNEAAVNVGENCQNPACAKDGDAGSFSPSGIWWGTEQKRYSAILKVPKMTEEEREEYNATTITLDPDDVPGPKEKERAFSHAGLARYAIDYTQLATAQELTAIRNKGKKEFSPVLNAKENKSVIKKKTNLLASIVPDSRRMNFAMTQASKSRDNAGFFSRIVKKIVKPIFADRVTVKTIGSASRDFSCIQGTGCWENSQNGDLVSAGALHGIQEGDLYADSTFTLTADQVIDGSTTDASHYMYLTAPASERHNGTAGTGVVISGPGNAATKCISVRDNYTRLEWLEITTCKGASTARSIEIRTATSVLIQYVIIHNFDDASTTAEGIGGSTTASTVDDFTVRNSIIYDGGDTGIRTGESSDTGLIENVTVYGMADSGADGIKANAGTLTVNNSISMNIADQDIQLSTAGSAESYNLCEDNDPECGSSTTANLCGNPTTCLYNKNPANQFVSTTGGSEDFHLKTGSDAIDAGTTIGTFSDDIDLDTRPIGGAWDIGADEIPENMYGFILLAPFSAGLFKKLRRRKKD